MRGTWTSQSISSQIHSVLNLISEQTVPSLPWPFRESLPSTIKVKAQSLLITPVTSVQESYSVH